MNHTLFIALTLLIGLNSCSEDDTNDTVSQDWLIPKSQVRDGGPGKDGIPALTNPGFIEAANADYLSNNDLVLGFVDGSTVRAYPHKILDWHEIINDDAGQKSVAIIYCPLTGTGIGWDRFVNNKKTTFGVSGLLYNSNIIPYDRETDSNWSQLLLKSVQGRLAGEVPKTHNLVETTWKTWKTMYPNTMVVSTSTGHSRNYGFYPYGDYKTSRNLLFPVSNSNDALHPKERVLSVFINNKAKAFRLDGFTSKTSLKYSSFQNTDIVIAGNKGLNFLLAFNRTNDDGKKLDFEVVQNELPVILKDNEGTKWDVFGRGLSGPGTGQNLKPIPQMMGYWFAFATFYPDIVYE